MWDVLLDAFLDTLKIFPFFVLLYILIEVLEHRTKIGRPGGALTGKWAPLIGSVTGLVPLCGFSVMSAKLYQKRLVTAGTLLAVFLSTSDEGLLVLLLSSLPWSVKAGSVLIFCAVKLAVGAAAGYALDALLSKDAKEPVRQPEFDYGVHEEHAEHGGECDELSVCEHKRENAVDLYLLSPLVHALQVSAAIFAVNFLFGVLFFLIGEDNVVEFLQGTGYWFQPLVVCLVGLVPNCASSVVIVETFVLGGISFGACLAGLLTCSGLGMLVLLREVGAWKRNLVILAATYLIGVAVGYAANLIALLM